MKSTPDQQRRQKTLIQKFSRDWEIRAQTLEIARRKKAIPIAIIDFLWRRQKVHTLYKWASEAFARPSMMQLEFPLKHDNIMKPKQMKSYFSLQGGWTMPQSDLKYLFDGPLFSEKGETLVKSGGSLAYYLNKTWPIILVIATILGIVSSVQSLFVSDLLKRPASPIIVSEGTLSPIENYGNTATIYVTAAGNWTPSYYVGVRKRISNPNLFDCDMTIQFKTSEGFRFSPVKYDNIIQFYDLPGNFDLDQTFEYQDTMLVHITDFPAGFSYEVTFSIYTMNPETYRGMEDVTWKVVAVQQVK